MPMTKFHNGARRKVAYGNGQAGARSLKVPLIDPHPQGQVIEGEFRVPNRLCNTAPHTNERMEFQRLVESMLDRWAEWRLKGGWEMTGTPKVSGPYPVPTETERHEADPDYKIYRAICRFKRNSPLFVGLDDFLHEKRLADIYGVDLEADRLPWNDVDGDEDTGWGDPMKWAEAERQKLGLKREDYLFGDLADPFGTPPKEGKGWQRVKL